MQKRILLTIFGLFGLMSLAATNYYVSPNGNDNNNGLSPATAFQTLDKINSLSFAPGDVIALEGGATFTGFLKIDDDGLAGNPITLTSYNGGIATIQCLTKPKAVTIESSHFVVSDLKIVGVYIASTDGSETTALTFTGLAIDAVSKNLKDITIQNIEVSKFKTFGIKVIANTGFTIDGIDILNCVAHNNGFTGIQTKDNATNSGEFNIFNLLIDNCIAHHNRGWSASAAGSGILINNVKNGIVQNCVAHHNGGNNLGFDENGNSTGGGGGGIWSTQSSNLIFQYNEAHHNETGKADGNGFNFDGGTQNCIMQYNYSHDNFGGGFLVFQYRELETKNITIRYNISENDGLFGKQGAVHAQINPNVTHHLQDIYIYNNTIYSDNVGVAMVKIHDVKAPESIYDIQNVHVYNNAFIQPNGGEIIEYINQGTATVDNNYRVTDDGNALVANPGNSSTVGNANFFDHLAGYQVVANSPLIDVGWNLNNLNIPNFGDMGMKDLFGNPIPNNGVYDIGAHEFNNNGACTAAELLSSNTFDAINSPTIPDWNFSTLGAGTATATINQWDNAVIDISNPGTSDFDIQLRQDNLQIATDSFYVLKIHARASAARTINFKLRNRQDGTVKYLEETLNLSTTFQEYAFVLQAPVSDSDVRLVLLFGGNAADIYLDEVSFEKYCGEPIGTQLNCIEYLDLQAYSISSNTFKVAKNIVSNSTINQSETVTFKAGESITLLPGFTADAGSDFLATIEACPANIVSDSEIPSNERMVQVPKPAPTQELTLQIAPNPLTHQAIIHYELPSTSTVQLAIYSLQGQQIKVLVDGSIQEAGLHQAAFFADSFTRGIYYLTLQTEDGIETRKMILK